LSSCPDKECQANLHKINDALFGKEGTGGIVKCLNNKVPKKWLYVILGFIAIPLITFGAKIYSKNQAFEVRFAEKTALAEQAEKVAKLEIGLQNIQKAIDEIKISQKELRKDLKESQKELQKDIKDILKELRFARERNEECGDN